MGNIFLNQRVQLFFTIFWSLLIVWTLYKFRYYRSLPIGLGKKVFYLLVIDRLLSLLIFLLKCTVCYDAYYRTNSFYRGCCSYNEEHINVETLRIMAYVMVDVWIIFWFIEIHFFLQMAILVSVLILEVWITQYYFYWVISSKDAEEGMRKVLCGRNLTLDEAEVDALEGYGFKIMKKEFGFGTFGTTYSCKAKDGNELALKVIDIIEWNKNRNTGAKLDDENLSAIRAKFVGTVVKLRALNHKNVVNYKKVHFEAGPFRRIYFISHMADMNLDYFLTHVKPTGVDEDWARKWFKHLCSGLHYLHVMFEENPFPHSNIKPENILLYRRGPEDEGIPKSFGISNHRIDTKEKSSEEIKDQFILKLSDCGFESFMPLGGKVITKRDPIIVISPPKKLKGKGNLRILSEIQRLDEQQYDDIYQLGVILFLLLKGDINRLIKAPKDTEKYKRWVTGVDGYYVRFDQIHEMKKLSEGLSKGYLHLHKRMTDREPFLRYDINQVLAHEWVTQAVIR